MYKWYHPPLSPVKKRRGSGLKVRFMGQLLRYHVPIKTKQEGSIMNENIPCTTSTGMQTFTGALFLLAIAVALTLVLFAV